MPAPRRRSRSRLQRSSRSSRSGGKQRVHEIAKQEGLTSKEVLAALNAAGVEAKAAASSVEEEVALEALKSAGGAAKPAAKKPAAKKPAAKKPAAKKPVDSAPADEAAAAQPKDGQGDKTQRRVRPQGGTAAPSKPGGSAAGAS